MGHGGGSLRYQFVPTAAKGPRHPQGRSELASGAGRAAALTGNEGVAGSQTTKRSPVSLPFCGDSPGSASGRPSRTQIEIRPDPRLRHKRPLAPDVEPLERVARFFRSVADHQRADVVLGCPFGNLAAELGTQDPVIRDRVRQVFAGYQAYFEQALREASADGKLRDSDVLGVAQALLAYFQGALLLAKTHNDATIIDSLADHAVNLVVGTYREKEPA